VPEGLESRIKWASRLVGVGLLIQVASLLPIHPLAFVGFLAIGCPLMIAGIVLYLMSVVSTR